MTTIPDGLPTLSAGPHLPSSGKACIMEYVSVLTGDKWTDLPQSTAMAVAKAAQGVNDTLQDDERHLILPFIHRLTAASDMNEACFNALSEIVSDEYYTYSYDGNQSYLGDDLYEHAGSLPVGHWDPVQRKFQRNPQPLIDFLDQVLTIHEQHVKHEVKEVTPEALADAKRLIENRALVV